MGEYLKKKNNIIAIEPVNRCYGTNFLNSTRETIDFIEFVSSDNIKLNLDIGAMIQLNEKLSILQGYEKYINHVHISEPDLAVIEERDLHKELLKVLTDCNYTGFVSIEMRNTNNIGVVESVMKYIFKLYKTNQCL